MRRLRVLFHPDSPGVKIEVLCWPWSRRVFATLRQAMHGRYVGGFPGMENPPLGWRS